MKKIIKSRLFIVIITTIIVASGTLYAANKYQASEVIYNASDGTTTDVNTALNDLYTKISSSADLQIKYLGTKYLSTTSGSNVSFSFSFTDDIVSKAKGFIVSTRTTSDSTVTDFQSKPTAIAIKINEYFVISSSYAFAQDRSNLNSVSVDGSTATFNGVHWDSSKNVYFYCIY